MNELCFMFETKARYFRIARHDLVYLKFILEAYEGLATLSTVERQEMLVIVRIAYPHFSQAELDPLLDALGKEIVMTEVPRPEGAGGLPPAKPVKGVQRAG